jgi:hypothetical protein
MQTDQITNAPRRLTLVAAAVATAALAAAACSSPTTTPKATHPVGFQIAAKTPVASATSGAALQITSFKIVAGGASLGNGDQFGCVDCQGGAGGTDASGGSTTSTASKLVTVPLNGGATDFATEDVSVGTYSSAEISVVSPSSSTTGLDASWPSGATMQISGTYNGTTFTLPLTITGSFREALSPPVTVAGTAPAAIPVRVTLPVASWFVSNGATLDPTVAANRAQIEANARAPFQATEGTTVAEQ